MPAYDEPPGPGSPTPTTPPHADTTDSPHRPVLALIAGSAAAAAGGLVWALIVTVTNYEVGWIAWGVGLLVGLAMARSTSERSPSLGVRAALLAAAGLVLGKLLIVQFAVIPNLSKEIAGDSVAMRNAVFLAMAADSVLPGTLQAEWDAIPFGDTLPDELAGRLEQAAEERIAGMDQGARDSVAKRYARAIVGDAGLVERLRSQLSVFDILWFLLAIGTAWQLTSAAPKQQPAGKVDAAGERDG